MACSFYRKYVSSGDDTEHSERVGHADDNSRLYACVKRSYLGPVRAAARRLQAVRGKSPPKLSGSAVIPARCTIVRTCTAIIRTVKANIRT